MSTDAIPRLGSVHDIAFDTSVSDVVTDLARLADVTSVPRPTPSSSSIATAATLDPFESWMLNVVRLGMCVQAILDISPLGEDETLQLLARLVGKRVVTFAHRH